MVSIFISLWSGVGIIVSAARKRFSVLTLSAALLVACGGGTGEDTAEDGRTPPATAAEAADGGSPAAAASEEAGGGPVTVENCGVELTFEQPPERVIALQHNTTEMLLALGLEDRMVGTAYVDGEILPEYQAAYDQVPTLGEEIPSQEVLLGAEPDFVIAGFGSILSDTGVGSREDLADLGIPSMLVSTSCPDRQEPPTLADVYADLRALGEIFGVEDRAEEIVAEMEGTIDEVRVALEGVGERPRVLVYDSGDDPPFVFGGGNLTSGLVEAAGGENVFADLADGYTEVNWEEVVQRDPEVIVLVDAVYSPAEDKRARLAQPPLSGMAAVREDRYITVLPTDVIPSVRNGDIVAALAAALHPEDVGG